MLNNLSEHVLFLLFNAYIITVVGVA